MCPWTLTLQTGHSCGKWIESNRPRPIWPNAMSTKTFRDISLLSRLVAGSPSPQYMHNLACKQYKRGDFLHITPSSHQMASPPSITRTQYHLHQLLQHKSILNYNTSVVYDISLLLVKYHHKQYFITSRFSDSITHGTLGIKHHEGNATILVPNGNTQNLSSKLYKKMKWSQSDSHA